MSVNEGAACNAGVSVLNILEIYNEYSFKVLLNYSLEKFKKRKEGKGIKNRCRSVVETHRCLIASHAG